MQLVPFTGPNSLVFAASLAVAATSIATDYLLTREMIYSRFSLRKSRASRNIDRLLGLNRGTDRLFKTAGFGLFVSFILYALLVHFALRGQLGLPIAALTGLFASTGLLSSILVFLTATKISTYRSLHPDIAATDRAEGSIKDSTFI